MSDGATKTDKARRELERLAAMSDDAIDTSDIPERRDWSGAETGKFYKPVKKQITLRIDAEVLAWFKDRGGKYQSAINEVLRDHMVCTERERRRTKR